MHLMFILGQFSSVYNLLQECTKLSKMVITQFELLEELFKIKQSSRFVFKVRGEIILKKLQNGLF